MTNQDEDPHSILGVPPTASSAEITQAFRHRLRTLHPDSRTASAQTAEADAIQLRHVLGAYVELRRRHHQTGPDPRRNPSAQPERPDRNAEFGVPPSFTAGPVRRHD